MAHLVLAATFPVDKPTAYFNWRNPVMYKKPYHNLEGKWNGKPVIVFVHGIRSNAADTWHMDPNVDGDALSQIGNAIEAFTPDATNYNTKGIPASNVVAPQYFINTETHKLEIKLWDNISPYYSRLSTSDKSVYISDMQSAFCGLKALKTKFPAAFFCHQNYMFFPLDADNRLTRIGVIKLPSTTETFLKTYMVMDERPDIRGGYDRTGQCVQIGNTIYVRSDSPVETYWDNEPINSVSNGVLAWAAKKYNRTDALNAYNGIEFIDFFNPRSSMDEYSRAPGAYGEIDILSGKLHEDWYMDTPYGWNGQIILQSIEILEKYWPHGAWKNNPNARLIFVCHSAGGLAVRTMVHYLAEAENEKGFKQEFYGKFAQSDLYHNSFSGILNGPPDIDIRNNIGKIITFCTPHAGGDGSWVDKVSNLLGAFDRTMYTVPATPTLLLVKIIRDLYVTFRQVTDLINTTLNSKCDDGSDLLNSVEIFDDLRTPSLYIRRIYDNFPLRGNGTPIPTVCLTFDGDEWGGNGLLSNAISKNTLNKYNSSLLEFTVAGLSGDDVHGQAVSDYINDDIFTKAFEFGGISPNTQGVNIQPVIDLLLLD